MEKKLIYAPPAVTITRVELESSIAAQSFEGWVDSDAWAGEQDRTPDPEGDIWVPF